MWLPVFLTLSVLAVVLGIRKQNAMEVLQPSARDAPPVPTIDYGRRARLQAEQVEIQGTLEQQRQQQARAALSINCRKLRRCVFQRLDSWQTEPCADPWSALPAGPDGSRCARVQEQ